MKAKEDLFEATKELKIIEKLKEEDLPFLCESAAADACAPGNPREASLEDFEEMFRKLM